MEQQHASKKKNSAQGQPASQPASQKLPRASQPTSQLADWLAGQPAHRATRTCPAGCRLPDAYFQAKLTEVGPKMAHGKAWEKHRERIGNALKSIGKAWKSIGEA
jgi:hypothetical protein